ncbi:MAG: PucR family transcriptional regulator ligand-binding domain-containing protein [Bacillota bacterium]|nr:PucR family transcriptional regulator ligand-binding domain-containing protein [Bacillota bacterium]
MGLLIKNIIEFNLLEGAVIAAGHNGSNNEVQWVNLMEILDSLDSLQKGELLITTGYQIDNYSLYKDIILKLKNKGVAGIAIQTGYYTQKIPDYIKDSANQLDFPVIELPQNLTFSHITHALIENINLQLNLSNDSDLINLKLKLNNITNGTYNNYINEMLNDSEPSKTCFFLFSIYCVDNNHITQNIISYSISKIRNYFIDANCKLKEELSGKKALFTVSLNENISLKDVNYELSKIITALTIKFQMNFYIGVSYIKNSENIMGSFNDALTSEDLLKKIGAKKGVCFFEDINLFKILEIFHYSNYSTTFAYDTLKELIDYDSIHNSSYIETLRLYLINECNINSTAEKLFVHRHTLKNRLNKITVLTGLNFESYNSKMIFSIALLIYDYFII